MRRQRSWLLLCLPAGALLGLFVAVIVGVDRADVLLGLACGAAAGVAAGTALDLAFPLRVLDDELFQVRLGEGDMAARSSPPQWRIAALRSSAPEERRGPRHHRRDVQPGRSGRRRTPRRAG